MNLICLLVGHLEAKLVSIAPYDEFSRRIVRACRRCGDYLGELSY